MNLVFCKPARTWAKIVLVLGLLLRKPNPVSMECEMEKISYGCKFCTLTIVSARIARKVLTRSTNGWYYNRGYLLRLLWVLADFSLRL